MTELSILEEKLLDEYFRCERNLKLQMKYLEDNEIHGYISKKIIRGTECYYLQRREGKHILSQYLPKEIETYTQKKLAEQKEWKKSIAILKKNMRQIEKAIGKEIINERRDRV